jgi:hypothetical protein
VLILAATPVEDDVVEDLVALKELKTLNLAGTDLSESAVARLKQTLPECRLER